MTPQSLGDGPDELNIERFDSEAGERKVNGFDWALWTPTLWRMVVMKHGDHRFPSSPRTHEGAVAWYGPITGLLVMSFGWPSPSLGLRRWYDAGRPEWDIRFHLLNRLWGEHLDFYAAWLWSDGGQPIWVSEEIEMVDAPTEVDEKWHAAVLRRAADEPHSPLIGGSDPLHLGAHVADRPRWSYSAGAAKSRLIVGPTASRRAVFMSTAFDSWYAELHRKASDLALPATGRPWRVSVVTEDVGSLGTFRLSQESGRWFSGRHRFHQLGIP